LRSPSRQPEIDKPETDGRICEFREHFFALFQRSYGGGRRRQKQNPEKQSRQKGMTLTKINAVSKAIARICGGRSVNFRRLQLKSPNQTPISILQ
jgi:hypothetical protein